VGDGFYAGYTEGWPAVEDFAHPGYLFSRVFEDRSGYLCGREKSRSNFERDWVYEGMA
jgi:hypothetical protein